MSFIPAVFTAIGKAVSSIGLGTIASVGSTVIGGLSAVQQARYQEAVAKANQQIANQNAAMALERSGLEAADQDALTLAAIGEQLALQSASGLSTDSRSNIMTRKTARELGRKDALNVRYAGQLTARNFQTQGMNFGAEAAAARAEAAGSLLGTFLSTGSLLSRGRSVRNPERYTGVPYARPATLLT